MRKCYSFLPDVSINSNTAAIILLSLLDPQPLPLEVGASLPEEETLKCPSVFYPSKKHRYSLSSPLVEISAWIKIMSMKFGLRTVDLRKRVISSNTKLQN